MHEGKSLKAVATLGDEVKMELDLSVSRHAEVKEEQALVLKKMELPNGILGALGRGSGGLGSSSGGGSAGEDSSSDEPVAHHQPRHPHRHRHSLPPKKYRLKESLPTVAQQLKVTSAFGGFDHGDGEGDGQDDDGGGPMEDLNPDDDDCSQKDDGRLQHSFTSGENSDSEMGGYGDGDDSSKQDGEDAGKKIFECDVCNMKFSNGANMRRHRMRHTGVKPFECRVCQKRFFRKDHLAEHMATHSKLLPFRCPICNKGFQRQIAMRAHFQNAHVGGSHDIVKACPLCTYKSGSMKSLRGHFYSRHGIDLDNPLPHSPSLQSGPNRASSPSSPGLCASGGGSSEYSELAHALGFEDRDKCNDSSLIPSHFLVPQIEISSNPIYSSSFPYSADSSYDLNDARHHSSNNEDSSSPKNISPKSDSSSNIPSSSDLVVVKREILEVEEGSQEQSISSGSSTDEAKPKSLEMEKMQDGPEDLSSAGQLMSSSFRLKLNSSSLIKISPLKSLLGEDWKQKDKSSYSRQGGATSNSSPGKAGSQTARNVQSTAHTNLPIGHVSEGEAITSSEGSLTLHSLQGHRELPFQTSIHQCIYCKIVFPDITLYFLHKGCHSDSSPWRCNICGEACCNVYDFNSHLLSKSHQ